MVKHLNTKCVIAAATTILLASGCSSNSKPQSDATPAPEMNRTERLEQTQMAAGARFEATMYGEQFDGPGLSSLGTARLDLILADSHSCNPLVIYLDVPDDDNAQPRREAVGRYLEDKGGLKAEQIEFHMGDNPATYHPAQPDINNYPKTDTASDSSGGGAGGSSSSGGSAGH